MLKTGFAGILAVLVTSAVLTTPALAQTANEIERLSPRMAVRTLSAEEKRTAKDLIAQFESTRDRELLDAIRPYAEAGDKAAMHAMVIAYEKTNPSHPFQVAIPLAGRWAVAYWELFGPDRDAARKINDCVAGTRGFFTGKSRTRDCGFDVSMPGKMDHGFDRYWQKKGSAPKNFTFVMRNLTPGAEEDAKRFAHIVSLLEGGGQVTGLDRSWAKEHAEATSAEQIAKLQAALDDHPNAVERMRAINRQISAEYRERDLKQWTALDAQASHTPRDLETFEHLSIMLGPAYLVAFGRRYVIFGKQHIDKTCAIDSQVCGAQLALYNERMKVADEQARARSMPIGPAASPFVDVRVYDQNGMFVGTQTMTRGQADTLGAK